MTSSRTGTGIMQDDPRASCARSYESAGKKKKLFIMIGVCQRDMGATQRALNAQS